MSRLFVRGAVVAFAVTAVIPLHIAAKMGYSRQILRAAELLIAVSDRLAARREVDNG
jgi:hypothetical protein